MKKSYLLLTLLILLGSFSGKAQQDPQYTQYMYNTQVVNPAYAGNRDVLSIGLLGLLLTLGACYRLAKFNIDTRQSDSFIGLPTPAMSLFVISLPLIQQYSDIEIAQNLITNNYFLIGITILLTYLMNAELPLFSLKFKEYSVKNNLIKYLFLLVSLLMIIFLQYISIPLIIILYVVLSVISNSRKKIEA